MTNEEVIQLLKIEQQCSQANCDRNCSECKLVQKQETLDEMYTRAVEIIKENKQLKYNLKCRDDELAESKAHITTLQQDLKNMVKRCKDYEISTCKGCLYLELEPDNEYCNHCYAGSRKNVL